MIFEGTIRSKVHLRTFRQFIKAVVEKTTGISVNSIIQRVDAVIASENFDTAKFEKELTEFVREYLIFNRKIVYSKTLSELELNGLLSRIRASQDYRNKLNHHDELEMLSQSELRTLTIGESSLIASFEIESAICLLFTSRQMHEQRVSIAPSQLRSNTRNFEQVYGIERSSYQSFDSIIIDQDQRIVTFCVDNVIRLAQKDHFKRFNELRNQFLSIFGLNYNDYFLTDNFFPLIDKYYRSDYGSVKSLSFRTNTASRKNEKMDRNGEDLRNELFHSSGVEAVDSITAFSIEMVLENPDTKNIINQVIPGTAQILSNIPSRISYYELAGAINYSDYCYVNSVMSELKTEVSAN